MSFALPAPTTLADGTVKMPWRWLMPTDPNDPRWAGDPAGADTARFRDALEHGLAATESRIAQNARDIEAAEQHLKELNAGSSAANAASVHQQNLKDQLVFLHERQQLAEQEKLGLTDWLDKLAAGTRIAVETGPAPKIVTMESIQSRLRLDRQA